MSDPTSNPDGHEEIRRTAAEASHKPRQVPARDGADPSNTPIEQLVAPLDPEDEAEARQMLRRSLPARPDSDEPAAA